MKIVTNALSNFRTRLIPVTHRILNTGVHAKFGRGYVWSEVGAVVAPYDTVEWEWNIATSGSSPGINIFEVDSPTGKSIPREQINHILFLPQPFFDRQISSYIMWLLRVCIDEDSQCNK